MKLFFNMVILSAFFLATGCASKKITRETGAQAASVPQAKSKPSFLQKWMPHIPNFLPKKSKPPIAALPQWVGSIRMVNTTEKFVLLESNAISSVIPGETYLAISNGKETASLRMTELKNPPFLIADIVSGDPSPGEKIYLPKLSTPSNAPPHSKPAPSPKPPKDDAAHEQY